MGLMKIHRSFKCDSPKIYYNILLDDHAGLIQAYAELDLLLRSIT